jgi:biopolymer transport protein ExbB
VAGLALAAWAAGQAAASPPPAPEDAPAARPSEQPATRPATRPTTQPAERSAFAELIDKIKQAREIGIILIALSVVGFAFAIERAVRLRRKTICPDGLAERLGKLMNAGRYEEAARLCDGDRSLLAEVAQAALKHRRFDFSDVSEVAGDVSTRGLRGHMQRAYPLAVVATLSPLLGLLGTVIGMINSFEAVALAGSMGDPSIMASDISYALVTTAMGLVIAVPSLGLYHFFRMRTNTLASLLDEQVSELISDWHIAMMARGESGGAAGEQPPRPDTKEGG